jgi:D-glycero-alpha-D-manno-heptose-7-phosphate kinase
MIITRSPMRISLGGGGTDLPSYYRDHTGFVMSAAIDKYVYITLHDTFEEKIILKYSKMELVDRVQNIQHPIIREALKLVDISVPHLEINSMSDIPAGTGLGSSGSFTTALLYALHSMKRNIIGRKELAEEACHIEIDLLGEPIGKQDQFIASYGGVTCFDFERNDSVGVSPLRIDSMTLHNLEDNLMLFFTKYTRNASEILKDQDSRSRQGDQEMIENLHVVKQLGYESKAALEAADLRGFAEIMHSHWEHKKKRTAGMSNGQIDQYYQLARENGALGGKLIGAGGGGFLMFYTEDKTRLRRAMRDAGLREVRFRFDFEGCSVIAHS